MANPKSFVWNCFTRIDETESACNLCRKTYKTGGGTTNLWNHLKSKHRLRDASGESDASNENREEKRETAREESPKSESVSVEDYLSTKDSESVNDVFGNYLSTKIGQIGDANQRIYAETLITQIVNRALLDQLSEKTIIS